MIFADLPYDLELEVLSRVPAKSLAKLQTTCKRWYALFRNPNLVKKNFDKAARELMILSNFRIYSIRDNLHGIHNSVDPSIEFTGKLRSLKGSKDLKISEVFLCDGLILCFTKGNNRLVVWDPCTGQTRSIKPITCYENHDNYALGYVNSKSSCRMTKKIKRSKSSCRSYKILRSHIYQNDQNLFEIYDFSSDSWRVLEITREWGCTLRWHVFERKYILGCRT